MSKKDTSLDDIAQSIVDLGTMVSVELGSVKSEQKRQAVLLEDLTGKFDKNIDLLTTQMNVKKQVDVHEGRIDSLETEQKTIKSVVKIHSGQLKSRAV